MNIQRITILGSTGSIGDSTLDVVHLNAEQFRVFALTAHSNWQKLLQQIIQFKPEFAVCVDKDSAARLLLEVNKQKLPTSILSGTEGLETVASADEVDTVMAAIVGAAGLMPTLAAVKAGKRILLANKEALVMAGEIFMAEVSKSRALLLPVDSEHNALFQCLPNHNYRIGEKIDWKDCGVEKLILTASGGPFLNQTQQQLEEKTPEQACAHPNWEMGKKISVDSATLMNKGLEVIEASFMFAIAPDNIEVLIHPQSIVHSMVSYKDGSVLAELGNPDMRTPIAHALSWPQRINAGVDALDLIKQGQLDFSEPDLEHFKCLKMAFRVLDIGGTAPAILNAANEIAVQAFLDETIKFTEIAEIIEETLNSIEPTQASSLELVIKADSIARIQAAELVSKRIA